MTHLISVADLQSHLGQGSSLVVLDCRFDLFDAAAGGHDFARGHIPGAHYARLDENLAGAKTDAQGQFHGRHPLPERAQWAAQVGRWGIGPDTPVVAYDDHGACYAARAWWLLRWLGHGPVRVLDGCATAWRAAGGAWGITEREAPTLAPYPERAPLMPVIDTAAVQATLGSCTLIDARAGERFRGEVEPLDRVAGHIPGARQRFFKDNLSADGHFKSPEQLRREFLALGMDGAAICYCGSGVTACHNLLALAQAGLGDARLYPGSWSEWCSDPQRPIARG